MKQPRYIAAKPEHDVDGKCRHVNRVCTDTRNTEFFLKRRIYRCDDCDDCDVVFHTAEIEVHVTRWNTETVVNDILRQLAPRLPDVKRHLTTLRRAYDNLQKALEPDR